MSVTTNRIRKVEEALSGAAEMLDRLTRQVQEPDVLLDAQAARLRCLFALRELHGRQPTGGERGLILFAEAQP